MDDPERPSPRQWATGRLWQWRAPLLLLMVLQGAKAFRDAEYTNLFRGIVFGAHEFGHMFFAFTGSEWVTVAGGSLMQLLIPIGAGALMMRQRDWFGLAVCGIFLASSLGDVSWYIGDARALELNLVSLGPDGGDHDWNYLLRTTGLLYKDVALARFTRFVGVVTLLVSTLFAVRLLWWMATEKRDASSSEPIVP